MSSIEIIKTGITQLGTDAIVNAANSDLLEGGGVCGAIFRDANSELMTLACREIGHCDVGSAVITPGFKLKAKYVIHAVGPRWNGGKHSEPKTLYSAYQSSLLLAKENKLRHIGFPLISAGIYGYPVDQAWKVALQSCFDFLDNNSDYSIHIEFAVLDDAIKSVGEKKLCEMFLKRQNKKNGISLSKEIKDNAYRWCCKYEMLFRALQAEDDIKTILKGYSAYAQTEYQKKHEELYSILYECMKEAYDKHLVVPEYWDIIEKSYLSHYVEKPFDGLTDSLSLEELIGCMATHIRSDYGSNGSWIYDVLAEGRILPFMHSYIKKYNK